MQRRNPAIIPDLSVASEFLIFDLEFEPLKNGKTTAAAEPGETQS